MRHWWVNHSQTFNQEVGGGFIWCPKRKKDKSRNHFYETLREVQVGDLVFSFAHGYLQAVGHVKLPCYSCPRPNDFGKVGLAWDERGWRVDVAFQRFVRPLKIIPIAAQIAPLLPARYSPIRENGFGNQGAYLAEISSALARRLLELAEPMFLGLLDARADIAAQQSSVGVPTVVVEWEDSLQEAIAQDESRSLTTRQALVNARRGQGVFKDNVARYERECRVTRVQERMHLVASHIKPWREATDEERLASGNGLLLTPSIDHLFDRGFISFADEGVVLVSPVANRDALQKMGVACDRPLLAGGFNSDQRHFLEYHRNEIFLKAAS